MRGKAKHDQAVLVFLEQDRGRLAEVSLELLAKGRELAERLKAPLAGALAARAADELARLAVTHGCAAVYAAVHPELHEYRTLPFAKAVAEIIRRVNPQIVLFGASLVGRDLAPRVASILKTGLTADCTDLQIGDYRDPLAKKDYPGILYQIRPAFGGNIIATIVTPAHRPQMATVREGVMRLGTPDPRREGEIISFVPEIPAEILLTRILDRVERERQVDLKKAPVVGSGGAGVGGPEGFQLLKRLAQALGGVVGASRAAVDAGWIHRDHQVGQTGTTVRPRLYVACGISGSVQHRAGMQESAKIVAVNTDPDAPIFAVAHYGIVGDLHQVLPLILKAYAEKGVQASGIRQ